MALSAEPAESLIAPPRRRSSLWLLCGLMVALLGIALWQNTLRKREKEPDLRGDTDHATAALAEVLAKTPEAEQLPLLLRYVQDSSPGLRFAAVDALGSLPGPQATDAIDNAFLDSASPVRQRAIETLWRRDRERGLNLLLAALRDEDTWIREAAVIQLSTSLGRQGSVTDRRAVPMLIKALEDDHSAVPYLTTALLKKLTGKPWRVSKDDTEAQKQATLTRWRNWWAQTGPSWHISSQYADVPSLRPLRTDPAPDFTIQAGDGSTLTPETQRGRVTLLNFWGTWCSPCMVELPSLIQTDTRYRAQGVDVVGIALAEQGGMQSLRAWCEQHGIRYKQALATDDLQEAFGDIHEVPVTVLIDKQGHIRYRWEGERDYPTFAAAVERLLKE